MIKIICGVYGYCVEHENGAVSVIPKDKNSAPFSIDPKREAELVAAGVAEYVTDYDDAPVGFDEQPPEVLLSSNIPEYNASMSAAKLREIGKDCGLTFKVGMSKADMVSELDAFFDEASEHCEDTPPTFDATEAVQ